MVDDAPQPASLPGVDAPLSRALTLGFAASVAMAFLAYLLRLPNVEASPAVVGVSLIIALAATAFIAGRSPGARWGWLAGLQAGLVAAIVSLIIVLPALVDAPEAATGSAQPGADAQAAPTLALAIPGWLAFAVVVGAIGGMAGGATRSQARTALPPATSRDWLFRFSVLACTAVVILLVIGGAVTSAQQGLAVPDWPTSFGANMFLLPLSSMTGGVFLEHAHRLFGALVGLTIAALAIWTFIADRRRIAIVLGALAFILVAAQGVMGGLRVTETSQALAAVHGLTAQLFFAFMCVFAAVLSPAWRDGRSAPDAPASYKLERKLAIVAITTLVIQMALGVVARHFDSSIHGVMTHAGFSVVALIFILAAAFRVKSALAGAAPAPRFATAAMHAVGLQMILGLLALWQVLAHRETDPVSEVLLTTAHQVVGALVLGAMTLLTVWIFRLTRRAAAQGA